jgi:hypothetical protein
MYCRALWTRLKKSGSTLPATQIRPVLRVLLKHNVDFIVVGGIAAVLRGAPINTFDLDIVHSRNPVNVSRLETALDELEAVYGAAPGVLHVLDAIGNGQNS